MKPALRWIPTEVWVDIFRCTHKSRREFAQFVDRIRNRKFAEFLQFFLHDFGKLTLPTLTIHRTTLVRHHDPDCLNKCKTHAGRYFWDERVPMAQTEMPDNIRFFGYITIEYFGAQTLDFLRRIRPLFDGVDVNFTFHNVADEHLDYFQIIFEHLFRLLDGIHSLTCCFNYQNSPCTLPMMAPYFADKLAQIKVLYFHRYCRMDEATIQSSVDFAVNWLASSDRDGREPRVFKAIFDMSFNGPILAAIKQQFLSAKSPYTFAVDLSLAGKYDKDKPLADRVTDFHLENTIGEQLHGETETNEYGHKSIHIYRHQADAGTMLREWAVENLGKRFKSHIVLGEELRLGPLDTECCRCER